LSFAQFEREVTSERIRDKIAASKRKGLWVGGIAPLGYATKDRKIVVVEDEAERVRTIFRSYLKLGSLNRLMADLREQGIVTKVRSLKTGRRVGGIPFTRGPLAHFLRNRFYLGEIVFKGEVFPGEQPAILDRDLFDAVQAKLNDQRNNRAAAWAKSNSLLIGRIYDDRGNHRIRYRYYVSSPLLHGQAGRVGSVRRVPAAEIEALVGQAVREHLGDRIRQRSRLHQQSCRARRSTSGPVGGRTEGTQTRIVSRCNASQPRLRRAGSRVHCSSCSLAEDAFKTTSRDHRAEIHST
jgi:site-specific DNA recombinase